MTGNECGSASIAAKAAELESSTSNVRGHHLGRWRPPSDATARNYVCRCLRERPSIGPAAISDGGKRLAPPPQRSKVAWPATQTLVQKQSASFGVAPNDSRHLRLF